MDANENSTKAQLIALNAYEMTLGKNNQIPLISNLGRMPPFTQITETKIVASDRGTIFDLFGSSVAISGNYAIVGARDEDTDELSNVGAVYIYKNTNGSWNEVQKIQPSDASNNTRFG